MTAGPQPSRAASADYRAAIAQWRLSLRTEVKRCSSLPSSMFDACDPALETHLAETAEAVLMSLLGTSGETFAMASAAECEQRRERVGEDEIRCLPAIAAMEGAATATPALEEGLDAEYLAILTDICCTASGDPLQHAQMLLARDFPADALRDLDALRARHRTDPA